MVSFGGFNPQQFGGFRPQISDAQRGTIQNYFQSQGFNNRQDVFNAIQSGQLNRDQVRSDLSGLGLQPPDPQQMQARMQQMRPKIEQHLTNQGVDINQLKSQFQALGINGPQDLANNPELKDQARGIIQGLGIQPPFGQGGFPGSNFRTFG